MWQLDERLRRHDQEFECPDECVMCERDRSLGRIIFAIACTLVTLSIVAVKW